MKQRTQSPLGVRGLFVLLVMMTAFFSRTEAKTSITKFADPSFCSTSFPTAYVSGNFSITETNVHGKQGFSKNQVNKTLIIGFSSANFQFNPGIGTVTATGTEVTILSYTIGSTSITVNITTSAANIEKNTINFNGIQVRATAAGNGYIRRTGGTLKIDNKSNKPSVTTSWGDLTSGSFMSFSSATASQAVTTNVFSGTSDNQILGVAVTVTGTCGNLVATSFAFNTTGTVGSTNPLTDIAGAKLYYTGTVNAFSTTTLFGSVTNPNGAFSITGSQTLPATAGTYYFWLAYDIKSVGVAVPGDFVDAQVSTVTLSGTPYTVTGGNPVGSRQISDNVYYSISNGNWNDPLIWSRSFGGPSCGCAPTAGNGLVYVYHNVTVNGTYTVDLVNVETGGNLTNGAGNALTITQSLNTNSTGLFNISSVWTLKDVNTNGTGTSIASAALTLTGSLSVGAGTTLSKTAGGLTVNGNLTVNGTLAMSTNALTCSNAAGLYVQGTGTITGTGTMTLGIAKTIPAGSNLTIFPVLAISSGINITNLGTVNMQNDITGGNVNSTWINSINAVLNMAGTSSVLMSTGTVTATAVPNEIIYSGTGAQNVKNTTYHNVTFRNATKTLTAALTVNNDIKIDLNGQLDASASNYAITLFGNWINNSTNATPFVYRTGTVNFSGNTTIQGSASSAFCHIYITADGTLYEHATLGKFVVAGNWTNDGTDYHNSSDVTFIPASAAGGIATCAITGTSYTAFNTVNINSGKTVTMHPEETDFEGNINNDGTIAHNNALVGIYGDVATQSIGGATTSNTLYQIDFDNNGTFTLNRPLIVADSLILTSSIVNSSATNTIKVNNTTANIIRGGSTASFVNGPLLRNLPNGLTTSAAVYNFPVGKTATYYPISFTSLTTGATGPTITAEAFDSNAGGTADGTTLGLLSNTEYWSASYTGNYTNGKISITRQIPVGSFNLIGKSSTQTGVYSSIGGAPSGNSINNSNLTGSTLGYFVMSSNCTASTWYADVDGDTYGDAGSSTLACVLPTGYVANTLDCDDSNSAINPSASEVCNGIDDNCNGSVDDGLTFTTYYADADGDGYGDAAASVSACSFPGGYVLDNTDCNDASAISNPTATEICDGLDNNCDGNVDEGVVTATISPIGSVTTCKGVESTFTATACEGCTYQWFKNDNVIAGATDVTYSTTKPGYYSVQVNVPGGCMNVSGHTLLSTIENPSANISFPNGLNLCAPSPGTTIILKTNYQASNTYAWYKDGLPYVAPDANTWRITPTATGSYTCLVTNATGCSRMADPVIVINACREAALTTVDAQIVVYPNPASDQFVIEITSDEIVGNGVVQIFDLTGQIVYAENIDITGKLLHINIDAKNLSSGVYIIKTTLDGNSFDNNIVIE